MGKTVENKKREKKPRVENAAGRRSAGSYRAYRKKRRSRALFEQSCLGVLIVALLFGISYATVQMLHGQPVRPALPAWMVSASAPGGPEDSAPEPDAPDGPGQTDDGQPDTGTPDDGGENTIPDAPPEPAAGEQPWNTAAPLAQADTAELTGDTRLLAVPANGRVSDDYFRDALFIGDSVTQGFDHYEPYKDFMRVCAYKGVGPHNILQNMVGQRVDRSTIEMWDDINSQLNVANIYILLGANALLSQSDEAFLKYYGDLLDKLRERFVGVPIYVQSLTPTSLAYGQQKPALARDHIRQINDAVAKMAIEKGLYYVDLWEVLADADGYLRADLSQEGLHLLDGSKYRPWLDYLATHTVYSAHNEQFVVEGPYA